MTWIWPSSNVKTCSPTFLSRCFNTNYFPTIIDSLMSKCLRSCRNSLTAAAVLECLPQTNYLKYDHLLSMAKQTNRWFNSKGSLTMLAAVNCGENCSRQSLAPPSERATERITSHNIKNDGCFQSLLFFLSVFQIRENSVVPSSRCHQLIFSGGPPSILVDKNLLTAASFPEIWGQISEDLFGVLHNEAATLWHNLWANAWESTTGTDKIDFIGFDLALEHDALIPDDQSWVSSAAESSGPST